jgi:hypothetical protein
LYIRKDFKTQTITTGIVYKKGFLLDEIWYLVRFSNKIAIQNELLPCHCGIEKNPFLYTIPVVMVV